MAWLSIASLLLAGMSATAFRLVLKRSRSAPRGAAERHPTVYELAYLAGGPRRVVDTALAVMGREDRASIATDGMVEAVTVAPQNHPIEHAVAAAAESSGGTAPVNRIHMDVGRSAAMTELADRLTRQRLLLPPTANRLPRAVRALLLMVTLAVLGVAIIALVTEAWWPAAVAVVGACWGVLVIARSRRPLANPLTDAGRRVLARTYSRYRQGRTGTVLLHQSRLGANTAAFALATTGLALLGLNALGDDGLREGLQNDQPDDSGDFGSGDFDSGDSWDWDSWSWDGAGEGAWDGIGDGGAATDFGGGDFGGGDSGGSGGNY
jgi:uncharacterized protein (TIGR04222 family)